MASSNLSRKKTKRIVVFHVDDTSDHLVLTKMALEDYDPFMHVESFSSPHDLLRRIEAEPCDCVVSDYRLGEMTAFDLMKRLGEVRTVPFFIYTSYEKEDLGEGAASPFVTGFFRKRGELSHYRDLAKAIRTATERNRPGS